MLPGYGKAELLIPYTRENHMSKINNTNDTKSNNKPVGLQPGPTAYHRITDN